jgi:histidinol-phosphatase (PHP family)
MIANYHTHTYRCNHAYGTEREYVELAIARGLQIFGFSDHTPQYFPGDYYTHMRMWPYQLIDYCATVRQLQREYRDRIQIPLGLEAEFYPAIWGELLPRLQDMGIEYLILGQHWLGNEQGEHGSAAATDDENLLRRYCHQVMDALDTGKFTYIAHPDLLNFTGDLKIYRKHMRQLVRAVKQSGTPLEINLLGLAYGKHYPSERFFEIAAEEGCPVILGLDAHAPSHVVKTEAEQTALEMVHRLGLELLETVELRSI